MSIYGSHTAFLTNYMNITILDESKDSRTRFDTTQSAHPKRMMLVKQRDGVYFYMAEAIVSIGCVLTTHLICAFVFECMRRGIFSSVNT